MKTEIWYTARNNYDSDNNKEFSWDKYLKWSKLSHLTELVSLDGSLNDLSFYPDFELETEWKYIVIEKKMITQFFNSLDYVIKKMYDIKHYNLLAVIREPSKIKANLINVFDFVGYDLIEKYGDISALTNCGGFDESFLPADLNKYGLITNFEKAKKIQSNLLMNNPDEDHADCHLFEVWRHKTIGRK